MDLYACWRSIWWPRRVRKVAKKDGHRNNSLFGTFLHSHDDAMLHLKVMSRGLQGSYDASLPNEEVLVFCLRYWPCNIAEGLVLTCMRTTVHRSCTLSFPDQGRCHDHTQRGT
ncbi:hypothetical protein M405DRAFT_218692 [Rhizopogon salebrosus TDB-379]|nr:hypothetical protein M405DRAFT_218692 [Rhizopogon salebrosus TDB-379]